MFLPPPARSQYSTLVRVAGPRCLGEMLCFVPEFGFSRLRCTAPMCRGSWGLRAVALECPGGWRGDGEPAKPETAAFGTTTVCQVVPRHLTVRGHPCGCHCWRSWHAPSPLLHRGPASKTYQQPIKGPVGAHHHSQSLLVLVPQSGNCVPNLAVVSKNCCQISLH